MSSGEIIALFGKPHMIRLHKVLDERVRIDIGTGLRDANRSAYGCYELFSRHDRCLGGLLVIRLFDVRDLGR